MEPLEVRRLLSTVVVNTLQDVTANDGKTSLREAVAAANSGDTVSFATSLSGIITLDGGELSINKNLSIVGPGANKLGIDA